MAKTFAIDENNDLYLDSSGNLAILTGINAVAQDCKTAAQAQLGEMKYNVDQGIPYFDDVWQGGVPNLAQFEAALYRAFLNVPTVTQVSDLVVTNDKNLLNYSATIVSSEGTTSINGNLIV